MKSLIVAVVALALSVTAAFAGPVTHDQAKRLQQAVNGQDCYGGEMETESNGNVAFEVDDAVCRGGVFDFKLDKDFNILSRKKS